MADNHDLLILPNQGEFSIVLSEARSSLAARGRKDAAALKSSKWRPFALAKDGSVRDIKQVRSSGTSIPQFIGASLRNAVEQGDADAQNDLGVIFEMAQEYPRGPRFLAQMLMKISVARRENVSDFYKLLLSPQAWRDYDQAFAWYFKAAQSGHAVAQVNIGSMYVNGHGVTQDYDQAVYWYRKAAEQGFSPAQCKLGLMYCSGQGVPIDCAQAAIWLRKAAEKRVSKAQYELGILYGKGGNGLPKDYSEAYFWLYLAASTETSPNTATNTTKEKMAKLSEEKYSNARDAAAALLTQSHLVDVQKRAESWLSDHC